jgi:hypothetical protein
MMNRSKYSIDGLYVRNATLVEKRVRLVLSPSGDDGRNFLKHLDKLGDSDEFTVDVDPEMLEKIILPDEGGSREHKLALLPGNFINLKVSLDEAHELLVEDGSYDTSYIVGSDERTGFRPTPKFCRYLRGYIGDLSRSFVFNHIRKFFADTNGGLVPPDNGQMLKPHQKAIVRILSPYSKPFVNDSADVRKKGVSGVNGDYLGVEQRINSIGEILEIEEDFARQKPTSPIHGKVTLSDVLGVPSDNTWREFSHDSVNKVMDNTRLGYAVNSLDAHIKGKLPNVISAHMERACQKTFTPEQHMEVKQEFTRFMDTLTDASQKRLEPLRKFCATVGQTSETTPEQGLAVLNYLAGVSRISPKAEFTLSDGTKLDFSAELKKVFADPRTFGAPIDSNPKDVQQAANAVLLHYLTREMVGAYFEKSNPVPFADSIDKLLSETEQKVVGRFTQRPHPVSNPQDLYIDFVQARNLLVGQMEEYLGPSAEKGITVPPKSLNPRLLEQSPGLASVTSSRGLMLNSVCRLFGKETIADDKVDALLREADLLTGRPQGGFREEVAYLVKAYDKSRAEAAYALLLHESIQQNNDGLAAKLQSFGEENIKDFKDRLEDELDSHVRARSLTVATLGNRTTDSPQEILRALNPRAQVRAEMAHAKVAMVSTAAMSVVKNTLRKSLEFYEQSLPSSLELNNIEGVVFSGQQAPKMVGEIIEESGEAAMLDYFRVCSIRDRGQRDMEMDSHSANLAERVSRSKSAVEVEADARCYPGGHSPRRHAQQLLKEALNKALLGKGDGKIDPHTFAPPSIG